MTDIEKFKSIVREHLPSLTDTDSDLKEFFNLEYRVAFLKGDGILAYTIQENNYFIWYAYFDKKLSNAKIVYNTAMELAKDKPVLYCGVKDYFSNNSIKLGKDLYQIKNRRARCQVK